MMQMHYIAILSTSAPVRDEDLYGRFHESDRVSLIGLSKFVTGAYVLHLVGRSLNDVRTVLDSTVRDLENQFGFTVVIDLSQPHDATDLASAVAEADAMLAYCLPKSSRLLVYGEHEISLSDEDAMNTMANIVRYAGELYRDLSNAHRTEESGREHAAEIFRECSDGFWSAGALRSFICNVIMDTTKMISDHHTGTQQSLEALMPSDVQRRIRNADTLTTMNNVFCDWYVQLHRQMHAIDRTAPDMVRTLNFLLDTNCKEVTLSFFAEYIGYNTSYLSYAFKNETGLNFRDYIFNYKMKIAAESLVSSHQNIRKIAQGLGYNDVVNFSRRFKKIYGLSPSAFRNKNRSAK